jgi:phosphohistidine phosphatase SixA
MYFPITRLVLLVLLSGLFASAVAAEEVVFIVRHAEKATTGGADPDLSAAGHARAKRLRAVLRDAGVARIFVTEFKRTKQTAAPLGGLLPANSTETVPAANTATLLTRVRGSVGNVLVVGHSNTVPAVIAGLGITAPIQIAETDFDNLFIVLRKPAPARLIRLHYR